MAVVDAKTQAENRQALDHTVANLNKVLKAGGVGATHGLERVAVILTSAVKVKLSKAGTGRLYPARRSKGQNRTADHRASAPGEPPAVDTGKYRASWDWRHGRDSHGPYVDVGTNDKRGPWFEFGTTRMAARPHLRPTVDETAATMTRTIAERVVASQVDVLNRLGKVVR